MRFNVRFLQTGAKADAARHLEDLQSSPEGRTIMHPKMSHYLVHLDDLDTRAANILKQNMLSIGGEVSLPRNVFEFKGETASAIISGTRRQFKTLIPKLAYQPFGLRTLQAELIALFDSLDASEHGRILKLHGREYGLSEATLVMGILNITPDSFSDGGQFYERDRAVEHALRMVEEGADILDVGGESTRPGAEAISEEEELDRVIPVIEGIRRSVEVPISIDTSKSGVARLALDAGADMLNDVSALRIDLGIAELAAERAVPLCLMHMLGMPKTMQVSPEYGDLMGEIIAFLRERAEAAAEAGVEPGNILVDPGIGFGKTVAHNLEILRRLQELRGLGYPVLIGPSRKSFIGRVLNLPERERLEGTAASVALSIANGADIVRVHDVKEMVRVAGLADAIVGKPGK